MPKYVIPMNFGTKLFIAMSIRQIYPKCQQSKTNNCFNSMN